MRSKRNRFTYPLPLKEVVHNIGTSRCQAHLLSYTDTFNGSGLSFEDAL